jgi:hypothetical protein
VPWSGSSCRFASQEIGHDCKRTIRFDIAAAWGVTINQVNRGSWISASLEDALALPKHKLPLLSVLVACALAVSGPAARAQDREPIAFIGHGAFFSADGKEVAPTPDFVARAQAWYRAKLLATLPSAKQAEFARFDKQLNVIQADGQARLIVQHRALEWLAANANKAKVDPRTIGKINALRRALDFKLRDSPDPADYREREEFQLNPDIRNKLDQPPFKLGGGMQVFSVTTKSGQAYLNECITADVPIPPPIGVLDPAGTSGWRSHGFIPQSIQFIVGTPAELRSYRAANGMCFALPRYTNDNKTTVMLDGVICLSQTTSKVCIWDNQMGGMGFNFTSGAHIPIGVPDLAVDPSGRYQAGGRELEGGTGGVCTDCHAGRNPYIVHPQADLGNGVKMGDLNQPPINLPTFSPNRYDPLVAASWPQNALSQSPPLVPPVCGGCHGPGGIGGAFPHLSSELPGYCNAVLAKAVARTMPPGAPGSQQNNPDVVAFRQWCGSPASAGPSDRGDPHLTTTNGINYDFQGAGEFTALRNSDTGLELQTRQTPVTTTNTPVANAYTGLASCVSLNTAVAARIGKHRVTYQPLPGAAPTVERLQLRIDGVPTTLPATRAISLGGGNRIALTGIGGGLDITAEDGTRVLVTPNFWSSQGLWYLNIEVLNTPAREGTMGYILPNNWLPLVPDGSSLGPAPASLMDRHNLLNHKLADAWRVTKTTTLFDYPSGTSRTPSPTAPGRPRPASAAWRGWALIARPTACGWKPRSGSACKSRTRRCTRTVSSTSRRPARMAS